MQKQFSILTAVLVFVIGLMTACGSVATVEKTNDKPESAKGNSTEKFQKQPAENQPTEKNSRLSEKDSSNISAKAGKTEFSEAKGSGKGELGVFAKWDFSVGSEKYEITNEGKGKKTGENSELVFNLSIEKNLQITRIYFAEYQNDLIILSEVSDSESGSGNVECFDKSTLKSKWQADINSFNVGKGIIEDKFAYLNAMGFVAKLDLDTGKYAWKYDDLYSKHNKFNNFDFTSIEGEEVIFTEEVTAHVINKISINKNTGKIIKVSVAKEEK